VKHGYLRTGSRYPGGKNLAGEVPYIKRLRDENLPYWKPDCKFALTNKEKVHTVTEHKLEAHTITATFQENGSCVVRADVIYAMHGGEKAEERFRAFSSTSRTRLKKRLFLSLAQM
jgi:hypothetical protein